jgi:hypothetical protein
MIALLTLCAWAFGIAAMCALVAWLARLRRAVLRQRAIEAHGPWWH